MAERSFDTSPKALFLSISAHSSRLPANELDSFHDAALCLASGLSKAVRAGDMSSIDACERAREFSLHRNAVQLYAQIDRLPERLRRHMSVETYLQTSPADAALPARTHTTFPLEANQLIFPEMLELIPNKIFIQGSDRPDNAEPRSWVLLSIANGPWYALRENEDGSYLVMGEALSLNPELYGEIINKYHRPN